MTTLGEGQYDAAPAHIAVIGVGGGGCNAVMRMVNERVVPGVTFVCVNTDVKSLAQAKGAPTIQIGSNMTHGMGAGGNPEVGTQAAEADRLELKKALNHADLVFITAGMGGGTGTGAAPVVAEIARRTGALTVGLVTTPFSWEGARRMESALSGVARLKEKVDNLIVIHNDQLLKLMGHDVPIDEALKRADEAVMYGILSVAELVNVPGQINVDLADVKTIMHMPGRALMAMGEARGANAPLEAAKIAVSNPLLDISVDGAKGILFMVRGGRRMTLGEVNAAGEFIASKVDPKATIFFGMNNSPAMDDRVLLTVIATGIPESHAPQSAQASFASKSRMMTGGANR
ncbi:MAG: cell division protein FtsZ [SAR202 cluster bacterium]|nr:cell division protein FtsZ [SAR202 cluster bacterium]